MNFATLAALVATMFLWGTSFVATKIVLLYLPPWAYMCMRFLCAAAIFLIINIVRSMRKTRGTQLFSTLKLPGKTIVQLLVMSIFEPGFYFVFETLGLERTSAASASLIIAAVPAVVALVSAVFLHEHLSRKGWFGLLLSVMGVVVITLFDPNPAYADSSLMGNIFVLIAVFSATGYITLARSISSTVDPLTLTSYQSFFAAAFFLPGMVAQGGKMAAVVLNGEVIGAFLFLVFGATLGAFLLYNFALSRVSAPQAAVFINAIPLVTAVAAVLVLGESLNWVQIGGGSIAILGLMLAGGRESAKAGAEITMEG